MALKLRPHHILALEKYMSVNAYKENSPFRSYLKDIYGDSFLKTVDSIAEDIFINNYEPIELISKQDEICDQCFFQESCAKKDYSLLEEKAKVAAGKYFNVELNEIESFSNPEVLDFLSSQVYNLETNKEYTILELFEKLKTPNSLK